MVLLKTNVDILPLEASALPQTDDAAVMLPPLIPAGIKPRSSRGGNASVIVGGESFERVCALAPGPVFPRGHARLILMRETRRGGFSERYFQRDRSPDDP